jgi:hypothetical protein
MIAVQVRKLSGERVDFQIPHSAHVLELTTLASSRFAWDPLSTVFLYHGAPVPTSTPIADLELPPDSFLVCYNRTFIPQPVPAALPLVQSDSLSCKKQYDRNGKVIPFNVDDLIDHIVHLQYTPEHARAALEYSAYDLSNAISLLVNRKTIEGQEGAVDDDDSYTGRAHRNRTCRFNDPPEEPEEAEAATRSSGRRSADEKKIHDEMRTFSDEQKMAVNRLFASGQDKTIVLQVYLACDKNETAAANCLASMT